MQPTLKTAVLQFGVPWELAGTVRKMAERQNRSVSNLLSTWVQDRMRQELREIQRQQQQRPSPPPEQQSPGL